MKIVCVCHEGNTRSVSLAAELKYRGHAAVAIGIKFSKEGLMDLVCNWADRVIVMEEKIAQGVPKQFHNKLSCCDVGRDRYYDRCHPELVQLVKDFCNKERL